MSPPISISRSTQAGSTAVAVGSARCAAPRRGWRPPCWASKTVVGLNLTIPRNCLSALAGERLATISHSMYRLERTGLAWILGAPDPSSSFPSLKQQEMKYPESATAWHRVYTPGGGGTLLEPGCDGLRRPRSRGGERQSRPSRPNSSRSDCWHARWRR